MKKFLISIVSLLLLYVSADLSAQSIKGQVIDETGNPVAWANIWVRQLSDSMVVVGTVADEQGNFAIESPNENVFVQCSMMGYQMEISMYQPVIMFRLKATGVTLNEVVVTNRQIVSKVGGYSFSMASGSLVKGKTTPEVLAFLPNITQEDGRLKLLGEKVGIIYVDGVEVSERELESIPSERIQSVKVEYFASAKEKANVRGGVLRIQLKKEKDGGFSGSVRLGASWMPGYSYAGENIRSSFSGRWGKFSLRNTLGYGRYLFLEDSEYENQFKSSNLVYNGENKFRNWDKVAYNRLHLIYDLHAKHTLGLSAFYMGDWEKQRNSDSGTLVQSGATSAYESETRTPQRTLSWQAVFNYTWQVSDKSSFQLTADALRHDLSSSTTLEDSDATISETASEQQTQFWQIRPTYQSALWGGQISVGAMWQQIRYQGNDRSGMTSLSSYSHMRIPSVYASFQSSWGAVQYDLGLRYQALRQEVEVGGVIDKRHQQGWFPSLSLMIPIDMPKQRLLNIMYTHTMEEVPYSELSQYKRYTSAYAYTMGNPDLKTPTVHQALAVFSISSHWSATLGYIHYLDPINFSTEADENQSDVVVTRPVNEEYISLKMMSVEASYKPLKWWTLKANTRLLFTSGKGENGTYKNQSMVNFNSSNSFQISATWGAGLFVNFEPTFHFLNRTMHSVIDVSGFVYHEVPKANLEFRLDLKPYRKGRMTVQESVLLRNYYHNTTHEQYVKFSFTWRFNGGKKVNVKNGVETLQEYQKTTGVM